METESYTQSSGLEFAFLAMAGACFDGDKGTQRPRPRPVPPIPQPPMPPRPF